MPFNLNRFLKQVTKPVQETKKEIEVKVELPVYEPAATVEVPVYEPEPEIKVQLIEESDDELPIRKKKKKDSDITRKVSLNPLSDLQ